MQISVALCTYNGAKYLQDQLNSIAAQTRLPDELVVCDDASSDETIAIIETFAHQAPFPVRLYPTEENLGSTRNFDRAIAHCTGDWIALADQDDYWFPNKLAVFEQVIHQHPEVGLVFSDAQLADTTLQPQKMTMWQSLELTPKMQHDIAQDAFATFDYLLKRNVVMGAACAFDSRYKDRIHPIMPSWVHDYWIAMIISTDKPFLPIPEPLMYYRQHESNQIGANTNAPFTERAYKAQQLTSSAYERKYKSMDALANHIAQHPNIQLSIHQQAHLDSKVELTRFRAYLPANRIKRWNKIMRLLDTYKRYAPNGIFSALRDVIAP